MYREIQYFKVQVYSYDNPQDVSGAASQLFQLSSSTITMTEALKDQKKAYQPSVSGQTYNLKKASTHKG